MSVDHRQFIKLTQRFFLLINVTYVYQKLRTLRKTKYGVPNSYWKIAIIAKLVTPSSL